ncbi:unnamed protein product [[Candida] boidinii]|uniref:Unnamed protein product n=1 Tax=Candida boidinii TaxID=5477 RepID=A0A9W6SVJ0_CANBO|nr:hypothetical protein B5S30_g4865 [[Candida] boidinii]OWB84168.1 hypothetical protein B5S33_g2810 [[Candida] boidinii]GME67683.1 unnamed protein product [[Candida] boidinii]
MQFRNVILASILSAIAVQAADVVTQIGDGQIQAPAGTPPAGTPPAGTPPAETPVETPVETPAETPVETPVETPAETPVETPVETPAPVPTSEESDVYVDVTSTPLTTVINPQFQTASEFVTITSTFCDDTDVCGETSAPAIEIQAATTSSGNSTSPDIQPFEGAANRMTILSAGVLGFAGLAFLL